MSLVALRVSQERVRTVTKDEGGVRPRLSQSHEDDLLAELVREVGQAEALVGGEDILAQLKRDRAVCRLESVGNTDPNVGRDVGDGWDGEREQEGHLEGVGGWARGRYGCKQADHSAFEIHARAGADTHR